MLGRGIYAGSDAFLQDQILDFWGSVGGGCMYTDSNAQYKHNRSHLSKWKGTFKSECKWKSTIISSEFPLHIVREIADFSSFPHPSQSFQQCPFLWVHQWLHTLMMKRVPTLYKLSGLSRLIMLNRYSTFLRVFATEKKYHWVWPFVLKSVARTRLYSYSDLINIGGTFEWPCVGCRIRIGIRRRERCPLLILGCRRGGRRVEGLRVRPLLWRERDLCYRRRLCGCNFLRRRWILPPCAETTTECCALGGGLFRRRRWGRWVRVGLGGRHYQRCCMSGGIPFEREFFLGGSVWGVAYFLYNFLLMP